MKKYKRSLCLIVAVSVISSTFTYNVFAQEATQKSDETMYINMDWYGKIGNTSVVKGYELNGTKEITDYGKYKKIINMSDYSTPVTEGDKVTFTTEGSANRFYFEGQLEENSGFELPWNIDVSYKLNGVDKNAEELAGAKGLVEINIDAVPNPNTSQYFRNNMILQAGTVVSMDDNLSVEAEGAQLQTIGNIKAIIFMAMPGEEQHFQIRIGSEDFSFGGLYFAMVPGTLSQLEDIKKLREDKEKIESSADAMSQSLDVMLNTMEGMQSGLSDTAKGLKSLDEARASLSNSKNDVRASADVALDSLKSVSKNTEELIPHMETAKNMLNDTTAKLNEINTTIKDFTPQLKDSRDSLEALQKRFKNLNKLIDQIDEKNDQRDNLYETANWNSNEMKKKLGDTEQNLRDLTLMIDHMPTVPNLTEIPMGGDPTVDILNSKIGEINNIIAVLNGTSSALAGEGGDLTDNLAGLTFRSARLVDNLNKTLELVHEYGDLLEEHKGDFKSISKNTGELMGVISEATETTEQLIADIDGITDILNKYEPEGEEALEDTAEFTKSAVEGIDSLSSFLDITKNAVRDSGDKLDKGTEESIYGIISSVNTALSGLAQTPTIKNAKNTIKDLVDTEWDNYSQDKMTFLNIDSSLKPVSFTSELNPNPESIQVIMRTQEITKNDDKEDSTADEDFHAEGNILTRIGCVLKAIYTKITSIFVR